MRILKNWNTFYVDGLSGLIAVPVGFIWIGRESIKPGIYKNSFLSWLSNYTASIAFAVNFIFHKCFIGYVLDKKKSYIKV